MSATPRKINWPIGTFLVSYHLFLLISLPFYFIYCPPSWGMVATSVVLLYLTGLSITAGYHRYFSHRAYKAHPIVEFFLLLFGSMAGQGSVLRWSFEHRIHHAFVDTDRDPYSIKKGFFYAHCGWLFYKQETLDPKLVPDLLKNKMVMFQHEHFKIAMTVTNLLGVFLVGWMLNDYVGAFFLAFWTRFLVLHHFTWFINSLAHTWGDKPFCQEQTAVNNYVISLLTFGEGYHNYHHTYANDYRNGIRWYQFDPTKWLIWTLNKLGLAHELKQVDAVTIKKRMVTERKNLLLQQIKDFYHVQKDELEKKVLETSDRIVTQINEFNNLKQKYIQFKNDHSAEEMLTQVQAEMRRLRKSLHEDWRQWKELSSYILSNSKPIQA